TQIFKTEKVITGIHDIFFVFKGPNGNLFNFDWWKFN
ncbi:MAG: carbohydrate-binding protein, partial [Pedobacter sp.]